MSTVQLWVSGILAILRVLISQSTEDIVLSRIQELSFSPYLLSCPVITRLRDGDSNSMPEDHSEGRQVKNLPEETFSRCVVYLSISVVPVLQEVSWCLVKRMSAVTPILLQLGRLPKTLVHASLTAVTSCLISSLWTLWGLPTAVGVSVACPGCRQAVRVRAACRHLKNLGRPARRWFFSSHHVLSTLSTTSHKTFLPLGLPGQLWYQVVSALMNWKAVTLPQALETLWPR